MMNSPYQKILTQLEPYKDKVFLLPLTYPEVIELEANIGQHFPAYFREFLMVFGIRQDLVFDLYKREKDFIDGYSYLPDAFKTGYIAIGASDPGYEHFLLNVTDPADRRVYASHYGEPEAVVLLDFTFDDLLERSIDDLAESYPRLELNTKKNWCVQFSIRTTDEQLLLDTIGATRTKKWTKEDVSPAGVHCYVSEIDLLSRRRRFSRQEYIGWETPSYYFNMREPALPLDEKSAIRQLDIKLKKAFKKYVLIDYGIMALPDED
jgi:hypothetical protein